MKLSIRFVFLFLAMFLSIGCGDFKVEVSVEGETISDTASSTDTDENQCVEDVLECVPDCLGKECGDDGCGGSCGDCNVLLKGRGWPPGLATWPRPQWRTKRRG